MAFDINAQLLLSAPKNLKAIRNVIQKELGNISIPVSLSIDKSGTKQIADLTRRVGVLEANLKSANKAANSTNSSLNSLNATTTKLSNSQKNLSASTVYANAGLQKTVKVTKTARTEMEAFGKDAALAIRRFSAFTIATGAIYGFVRSIQGAVSKSIEFQRELSRLVQVADATASQLRSVQNTVDELATTLGIDANELLKTAVTFAQAGQSIGEVEDSLRAVARASLTPSFGDMQETTEGVIAALEQFDIQANRTEAVLGSINSVSKAFAVESEDLIAVIRRAGGVFAAASGDLSKPEEKLAELLAIFTSVRSTTRESAETIATGLRTIFSRLQRPGTIEFLKQFNIDLVDTEGKFVGFYEAFKRISSGIEGITAKGDTLTLAKIVEELGGIRQISKLLPAIQQFSKAEAARKVALEGTESISKDVAIATETLASRIEQLQQNFQKLIRDITDSAAFQNMASFAIETANAFLTLADALRPVLPLITTLTAIKVTRSAFDFAGGFLGGIKRGGGAKSIGTNFSDVLTGGSDKVSKDAAKKVQDNYISLNKNTEALNRLTTKIDALASRVSGPVRKFAKGGPVFGPSHSAGGVPAELEGGEYVLSKKDVKKFARGGVYRNNDKPEDGFSTEFNTYLKKQLPKSVLTTFKANIKSGDEAAKKQLALYIADYEGRPVAASQNRTAAPKTDDKPIIVDKSKKVRSEDLDKYPNRSRYNISKNVAGIFLSPQKGKSGGFSTSARRAINFQNGEIGELVEGSNVRGYRVFGGDISKSGPLTELFKENIRSSLYSSILSTAKLANSFDNRLLDVDASRIATKADKMVNDKQVLTTISGYLFEGFLDAVTGANLAGGQASFDIPVLDPSTRSKLNILYGTQDFNEIQAAEAKSSENRDAYASIVKKIINAAEAGNKIGISKLASGGMPATTNALLTPEELVFGPKAVKGAGLSGLTHFNKTGDTSKLGSFDMKDVHRVPGTGNGDTVPAVLPNNSFVIKKKSAKKFATGGAVSSSPSSSSGSGVNQTATIFKSLAQSGTELFFTFQGLASIDFTSFQGLISGFSLVAFSAIDIYNNFVQIKNAAEAKIVAEKEATKSIQDLAAAASEAVSSLSNPTDALDIPSAEDALTVGVLDNTTRNEREKTLETIPTKRAKRGVFSEEEKAARLAAERAAKQPTRRTGIKDIFKNAGGSIKNAINPSFFAKALKPSIGAIIASVAVGPLTDAIAKSFGKVTENGVSGFKSGNTSTAAGFGLAGGGLSGAISGGGTGALIGSIFGPIGTAIGGAVGGASGAIVGSITGVFDSVKQQLKFNTFTEFSTMTGRATIALQELGNNLNNQDKVGNFLKSQELLSSQAIDTANSLAILNTKSSETFNELGRIIDNIGGGGRGMIAAQGLSASGVTDSIDTLSQIPELISGNGFIDSLVKTNGFIQDSVPVLGQLSDSFANMVMGIEDPTLLARNRSARSAAAVTNFDNKQKGQALSSTLSLFDPNELQKSAEAANSIMDTFISNLSLEELQALTKSNAQSTNDYIKAMDTVSPTLNDLEDKFKGLSSAIGLNAIAKVNQFGVQAEDKKQIKDKGQFDAVVTKNLEAFQKAFTKTGDSTKAANAFATNFAIDLEQALRDKAKIGADTSIDEFLNIDPTKIADFEVLTKAITSLDATKMQALAEGLGAENAAIIPLIASLKGMKSETSTLSAETLNSKTSAELLTKALKNAYKEIDALSAAMEAFAAGSANASSDFGIAMENINSQVSLLLDTNKSIKRTRTVNPFENTAGRSDKEITSGIDRLGNATGNKEALSGVASTIKLNRDLPSILKSTIDSLKNSTEGNVNASTFTSGQILDEFNKQLESGLGKDNFNQLPQEIKDAITFSVSKSIGEAGGNRQEAGGQGGSIGIAQLEGQLETSIQDFNNQLKGSLDPIQKAMADATNSLNEFNTAVIESGNLQIQTYRLAAKNATESLNRRKTLEDRLGKFTNKPADTFNQAGASLKAQLETIAQGGTGVNTGINTLDPAQLLNRRDSLVKRKDKVQSEISALDAAGKPVNTELINALAKLSAQLEGTETAIGALSDDVTMLDATESELANIEKSRMSAQERAQFLTSQLAGAKNPQERAAAYNELLKPITAALQAARGESIDFAQADAIFKNQGTIQDFFGATDAQMAEFIANATKGVQTRAATDISGLTGNNLIGQEAARRLFGAGSAAPGTSAKEVDLMNRAREFSDRQGAAASGLTDRNIAGVTDIINNELARAKRDAEFKFGQANDQARILRGQGPANNTILQREAPQRAQAELAKISNDFSQVFTAGAAAFTPIVNNLNLAAETLKTLPALTVSLDAKVGPVEVILNGANIINTFGEKMKGEILNAVSDKLRSMGLVRNASGELGDTSL